MTSNSSLVTTYSLRKKFAFYFIIYFVFAPVLFLAAEAFIKFTTDYNTPETIRQQSLQYSPVLFSKRVFPSKELKIEARGWTINSSGYRGAEFTKEKAKGTIRIIVFG